MSSTTVEQRAVVDPRVVGAVGSASAEVVDLWQRWPRESRSGDLPGMGLLAGERPIGGRGGAGRGVRRGGVRVGPPDARRDHRPESLPLVGPGAVLGARGWAGPHGRRWPVRGRWRPSTPPWPRRGPRGSSPVSMWMRSPALADRLEPEELVAVIGELVPLWGHLSPKAVAHVRGPGDPMLHPPPDPEPDEAGCRRARSLSFALTADAVVLSGVLPRVEGEAVIAAVEAFAERLRTEADHVPASARRAMGWSRLVNAAHAYRVDPHPRRAAGVACRSPWSRPPWATGCGPPPVGTP